MTQSQTMVVLGRNGDLISSLPLARFLHNGNPIRIVTSREYIKLLDGVSYATPIPWEFEYTKLSHCLHWLRRHGIHKPYICQSYCHPDCNKGLPYQEDAYRIAGFQNLFGSLPLIFDRRNPDREYKLMETLPIGKPWIAVSTEGISSPCPSLKDLIPTLVEQYPEYEFIDLAKVKAHRLYDIIGILDNCDLLISIDTVWLHLARAAECPVFAVLNDLDPWRASVPPPATIRQFGYKNVTTGLVAQAFGEFASRKEPAVWHCAQIWGQEERNMVAYRSWKKLRDRGMKCSYTVEHKRTFDEGHRKLPFIPDLLESALEQMDDHDVVLLTNDDIEIRPETIRWAKKHVGLYGAASMRRDPEHVGRDLFAFTKKWLKDNPLPDMILGGAKWDILVAAMIRYHRGVKMTHGNMKDDFYPCEDRILIRHQTHEEGWTTEIPSSLHNQRLFEEFMTTHNMKTF